ncbi:MAG: GNAT family N-acetyltransferase [Desulfobacterales bacterium]|jgi:GNAT superfamily N-acetyltransferase|nr:GNAT family N-acetyltransferase [Desulfobacteraceae bacterium]MDY0311292.1 GNAT family N-acetyltransferase [Desulfobacterales bacterium]
MAPFRESIRRIARKMETCEEWIELERDLREPIAVGSAPPGLALRWAEKRDLFAINALEGFVKETDFMAAALDRGDRCLLLEDEDGIQAFAWVTFTDFKLALWYTLSLAPGECYLVYIFVHPYFAGQGVGTYLLGRLMTEMRDLGAIRMISGMYRNWEVSFRLHSKMGFRIRRTLSQCRLLNIFPTPPRAI